MLKRRKYRRNQKRRQTL